LRVTRTREMIDASPSALGTVKVPAILPRIARWSTASNPVFGRLINDVPPPSGRTRFGS